MVCGKCTKRISHIPSYVKASAAGAGLYAQGYVMLARSGGRGGGRRLAGRGVSPPRLFLSGGGWGALNSPGYMQGGLARFIFIDYNGRGLTCRFVVDVLSS
jgi:hypothetical protein